MRTYYVTVEIEMQGESPQEVCEVLTTRLATIADRFIVGDAELKEARGTPPWPDQPEDYGERRR